MELGQAQRSRHSTHRAGRGRGVKEKPQPQQQQSLLTLALMGIHSNASSCLTPIPLFLHLHVWPLLQEVLLGCKRGTLLCSQCCVSPIPASGCPILSHPGFWELPRAQQGLTSSHRRHRAWGMGLANMEESQRSPGVPGWVSQLILVSVQVLVSRSWD